MSHSVQSGEGLSVVRRCAQWWRNWNRARKTMVDLDRCGPAEAEHIARDLNVSRAELRVLASKWPDDLLSQRLGQLNLDAAEIVHTEPEVLRDLQRVCTVCGSKRKCGHDLADHPSDSGWVKYCPNATTLDALIAERQREPADDRAAVPHIAPQISA
jgi:hypothetical protein